MMNRSIHQKRVSLNQKSAPVSSGFTIIEILIVLAIVALILMVILLAVPALQRNERNTERRHAVGLAIPALEEYKNDNDGHLPGTIVESQNFLTNYFQDIPKSVTVDFRQISAPHDYIPPYDTIAIQYAHWCNRYGNGENASDPIAGNDTQGRFYAIWTRIETATNQQVIYCVDNYGK